MPSHSRWQDIMHLTLCVPCILSICLCRWTWLQLAEQQCSGGLHLGQRLLPCQGGHPFLQLSLMMATRCCKRPCHPCRSAAACCAITLALVRQQPNWLLKAQSPYTVAHAAVHNIGYVERFHSRLPAQASWPRHETDHAALDTCMV